MQSPGDGECRRRARRHRRPRRPRPVPCRARWRTADRGLWAQITGPQEGGVVSIVLHTHARPGTPEFERNEAEHRRLVAELRERLARAAAGGGEKARERHAARGKLLPRERVDRSATPAARSSSSRRSPPRTSTTAPRPAPGSSPASARVHGREVVVVANDATVKGGTYYPMTRQEAPARAGGRAAEPPAVRLPRRLRRRLPAAAGRGLPRPRALRPHLLQPGDDVGAGDPADRRGDGLLHRRRRLRPGDERRDGDRARPGDDLPRRPAAREGGDRRGA